MNSPAKIAKTIQRNKARRQAIASGKAKVGDGKQVHHVGGLRDSKRTKVVSVAEHNRLHHGKNTKHWKG